MLKWWSMSREIVIVDDHEAVRDALLGMVQEAGYTAVAFSGAAAALDRIAGHRPALVLLDMMMPEIDGADFLGRMATLESGKDVPVIVVSALGHLLQGLRQSDVNAAGVAEVLAKPINYTQLIAAVRRVIGPP
jgi:two-component system, OmpR family, response regulator MprA